MGLEGQAAIGRAKVSVDGYGLAAEVCALYLAGAGVGTLLVDARLRERCAAQNREVNVLVPAPRAGGDAADDEHLAVCLLGGSDASEYAPGRTLPDDPVGRGAIAARWALARIFGALEERRLR